MATALSPSVRLSTRAKDDDAAGDYYIAIFHDYSREKQPYRKKYSEENYLNTNVAK